MNKEELKQQYNELVSGTKQQRCLMVETKALMCMSARNAVSSFTPVKDKGVTPFAIKCRHCDHGTMTHDQTISEQVANVMAFEVHNWVRPTFEQLQKLSDGAIDHVLNGGLMLEDELNNEDIEVKATFDKVHELLDSLQETGATCMFIGHEGNHFVISGNPTNIEAQIVFAMCRYPVVKDIIKTCATRFDELNEEFGDGVRNVTMDHLIEINSGN